MARDGWERFLVITDAGVSIHELGSACGVGRDGSSAADMVKAGRKQELKITGWRLSIEGLRDIRLPAILFWVFNHFVVLEHIGTGKYRTNDPANGRRTVSEDDFDRGYTGVALTLEPAQQFRPGGLPPGTFRNVWLWLRDAKAALTFAVLCGLLLVLPAIASPIFLKSFVDGAIANDFHRVGYTLAGASMVAGALIYLLS